MRGKWRGMERCPGKEACCEGKGNKKMKTTEIHISISIASCSVVWCVVWVLSLVCHGMYSV